MEITGGMALLASASLLAAQVSAQTAMHSTEASQGRTKEARAYLDEAIRQFRDLHINAAKVDWRDLTAKAYAAAAGAKTAPETYPAIRLIIKNLGEKHTFLIEAPKATAALGEQNGKDAEPAPLQPPEVESLTHRIAIIRLFTFEGSGELAKRYAEARRTKLSALESKGACRFIVDLRQDLGGNMYPMISAVGELLGDGTLGSFEDPHGRLSYWALRNGEAIEVDRPVPANASKSAKSPVAVLIGPGTASAGEYTALSFQGRKNTRFFGSPTGGFITANGVVKLSDGALIAMSEAWGHDRTGKKYLEAVLPDENTGDGDHTVRSAIDWLARQPCPSGT